MFTKILVGVDDSQQSSWAVDAAAKMAVESRAQVALLHIVDATAAYMPDFGFAEAPVFSELR
jgi:nucleotide-binding universal stress UspA family protein